MNAPTLDSPATNVKPDMPFIDRRSPVPSGDAPVRERRQFSNTYTELSNDAAELALAVDEYKARHRRRFINYEELLNVVKSLGYKK